jgi:NADP-dependent 3-hydroxy acid dehydrogenase YdfG
MQKTYTLITGASAGIGKATAELLAKQGRNLILIARGLEKLKALKKELEAAHGVEVIVQEVDVSDIAQVDAFFATLKGKHIDALINNAGLARDRVPLDQYDWKDIEEMIGTNIRGFTRVAQLGIPFLKATKGHIVNISSIAGIEGFEGSNVYSATKAYVKMLSKNMRIDLHGSGVRVTDIAPGAVETEFSVTRYKGDREKAKKVYEGFEPLHAEDIASAILYALMQPPHVNVEYMLVMPTAQASQARIARKG